MHHADHGLAAVQPDRRREVVRGRHRIGHARIVALELGPALRTNARIAELTPTSVRLENGEVLQARAVIDGRGPRASRHMSLGYQTFLGQELTRAAPHGLQAPVIMDASVEQDGGRTIVWLASDDNFSAVQRTLLLKFVLEEEPR